MSKPNVFRRSVAVALCSALALSAAQPAFAAPMPVSKSLGIDSAAETVQYRRNRPVAAIKRKRGNGGAAAAAILGAVVVGAAAFAASNAEKRRQRRAEREAYYYGYPQGYAPVQQYYAPAPQPQYYGGGYYQEPARDGWRQRRTPVVDGGSPYAVQQQRVRQPVQRYQQPAPQYYQPQTVYPAPRGYEMQSDGSARPRMHPYQLNGPPIIPAPVPRHTEPPNSPG